MVHVHENMRDRDILTSLRLSLLFPASLMGAGLHRKNGLPQKICMHLYQIYILPILVYGLAIFSLEDKHIRPLEGFQKTILKQILSMADNTADPAVYILSGAASLDLEIHRQALSIFGSITRQPYSAEYELARRQLIMLPYDAEDWYCYICNIRRLCSKYNLILTAKVNGKHSTTDNSLGVWSSYKIRQTEYLKKARFLNPYSYHIGKPHPVIRHASERIIDIQKCTLKLQIITGSYILQAHRAKFSQFEVKSDCLLCGQGKENRSHFLVECAALQERRLPHISLIKGILESNSDARTAEEICNNSDSCTALILDCTSKTITSQILLPKNSAAEIETISRKDSEKEEKLISMPSLCSKLRIHCCYTGGIPQKTSLLTTLHSVSVLSSCRHRRRQTSISDDNHDFPDDGLFLLSMPAFEF